ncbi:MAG: SEL1-like repeat protein [Bacteroidaceae bacterium]|nr:SEL1-like repeat protein [Bacteroidaceae bacterium]
MGTSVLHIKTEVECRVYLFDEEKGIAKPGTYFNLEVRKGEQDLRFVSTEDETMRYQLLYTVEENNNDYRITVERSLFNSYSTVIMNDRQLAEQGNMDAQYIMWVHYTNGEEVGQKEAVKWLCKAAEQGHTTAECVLAWRYERGDLVEQDREKAVMWFRRAAEQGDSYAQFNLGCRYENGEGVEQDSVEAFKWWRKAAEQGDADAQCNLGECYYHGCGVEQNYNEAVRWYSKSADQGDTNAQCNLGTCYFYGNGVERDGIKAMVWFHKAADQGNPCAQCNLGYCYEVGWDVKQDYKEAVLWYFKSAEQGYADAQYNLGCCYEAGKGVEQDFKMAFMWFRKAAEQGDGSAQYELGRCYENVNGVERDWFEAMKWFRKAAEQGLYDAQYQLNRIENNLRGLIDSGIYRKPYFIFFDTETTGVPRDYNAPASNTRNWPRLVQLGWIVTDEEGNVLSQGNEIVKPEGFVIPADAARVHGITTERAQREGKPLREVIEAFLKDAERAKCIVGHNISFDQKVVGAELYRLGIPDTISTAKSLCTMQTGTDYCKIPGYYGYKWPKLQELYHKLFGCDFEDAHDALADITATKKCFFEMRKRGLI